MNGTNWKDFIDSIHEVEAYQQKVKSGYVKDRNKYTKTGKQKKGGAPFDEEPPEGRSKSSPVGFGGALEEEVEPESFDTHDTLQPDIWDGEKIKSEIREKLVEIAMDFMEGLPIAVDVKDITLTGSLANYNWSNYSDVDLHIIVNYLDVDENIALVKAFFDNARMKWNNDHDIKMKGYDVEIYVEDQNESHKSSGLYSLKDDKWLKRPKKYRSTIDFPSARKKAEDIEFQVNIVNNLITAKKYETAMKNVERIKRKISNMRRAGLESTLQEFSIENIAFKILRRNDTLAYLNDLKKRAYDDMMTVNEG